MFLGKTSRQVGEMGLDREEAQTAQYQSKTNEWKETCQPKGDVCDISQYYLVRVREH